MYAQYLMFLTRSAHFDCSSDAEEDLFSPPLLFHVLAKAISTSGPLFFLVLFGLQAGDGFPPRLPLASAWWCSKYTERRPDKVLRSTELGQAALTGISKGGSHSVVMMGYDRREKREARGKPPDTPLDIIIVVPGRQLLSRAFVLSMPPVAFLGPHR